MRSLEVCRCLAVALLLAAAPRADADEPDALAELEKLGAVIGRDEGQSGKPIAEVVWISQQVSDRGLKRLLAHKDVSRARIVYLSGLYGGRISDAGLTRLGRLDRLEELTLNHTGITDATLARVEKLARLERLDLNNTAITDAGLKHLAGLRRLRSLELLGTKVTDQGVAQLRKARPGLSVTHKYALPRWYGPLPRPTGGSRYNPKLIPGR